MSPPQLHLRGLQTARLSRHYQLPLGRILVDMGVITAADFLRVLAIHSQCKAPIDQVLLAEGFATAHDILHAQAAQHAAISLVLAEAPPDPACAPALGPLTCLEHGVMPWMRLGETLVLATCHPDRFEALRALLPDDIGPVVMGIATEADIHAAIAQCHGPQLSELAETGLPEEDSCRSLRAVASPRRLRLMALAGLLAGLAVLAQPVVFFALAAGWAVLTLAAVVLLRLAAFLARLRPHATPDTPPDRERAAPPKVSILVPLFRETSIAARLVTRLSRLTYPKSRLDVVLLLEDEDILTRKALLRAKLPPWMRILVVPPGELTTKPRALNYGLRFCDGDIIGIYDAEDNPAPDQIGLVAAHFEEAPPEVACLQGILDYYNPQSNWLSRCFTIEYATWFRIVLPGMSRMGFPIPLGGTTLFCRRKVLEAVGGWDAHNVTEDADLGIRLARRGFRIEMIDSVTLEEANCRAWPWIRQRSRWLKGYMATYLVHMRRPGALLRDLGWKRFMGFQALFLGAISQFLMAPVLWSFWIAVFGLPHPLVDWMGPGLEAFVLSFFVLAECTGLVIGATAVASPQHRGLIPWVPTLLFYFPMGSIAIYKGLAELLLKPFYWDKTDHGHSNSEPLIDHRTS
ncbi:glycosyltransferase family 2 protein [Marinovum sp.]|uniref:glycosyltransferase family 2 protein n=1 Tax=Marinovum sp. TaxID=2024839 RepID=UPI002B27A0D8|nr:glycosyltransferase family 2 protein [Marinovum sp.]